MQNAPYNAVYCRHCKRLISPSATFCETCGHDQRVRAGGAPAPPKEDAVKSSPAKNTPADTSGLAGEARTEYIRQWATLTWYTFFSVFAFFFGLLGIVFVPFFLLVLIGVPLFIYSIIQKHGLRRRVAEAGESPDGLAHAGSKVFWNQFGNLIVIVAVVAAVLFGMLLLALRSSETTHKEDTSRNINGLSVQDRDGMRTDRL